MRKTKQAFWIVIFALTVYLTGAWVVHYAGGVHRFIALASRISTADWIILALATAAFYYLDYVRFYTLFAVLGQKLPFKTGIRLTCVSYFVSTLTPTAELNIPAILFLLNRDGVPASKAAAVVVTKSLYIAFWICVVAFGSLCFHSGVQLPQIVAKHLVGFTAPFWTLIVLFFYVIIFPGQIVRWTTRVLSREPVSAWKRKCVSGFGHLAQAISAIGQSIDAMHFAAHASCLLFIGVYIVIGATLAHALGIPLAPVKALTIFSNSLMVTYLAPVPGGMGATEMATTYLLDPKMSESAMVVSALLRFLCWYIVIAPGALFLLDALRRVGWAQLVRGEKTVS
jgi:uncharacterized protein (TIRG00374 family)